MKQSLRLTLALVLASLLVGVPDAAHGDMKELGKKLKSKDVSERLEAVADLRSEKGEEVTKLLISALDDRDWEVMEEAVTALGEVGGDDAPDALAKMALTGPVRRVRIAAARALVKTEPFIGAEALSKKVSGKNAERACEALAIIALGAPDARDGAAPGIRRGLKNAASEVKRSAARGLIALPSDERSEALTKLLGDEDVAVVTAVIDGVRAAPDIEHIQPLIAAMQEKDVLDIVERRLRAALRDMVATQDTVEMATEAAGPVADALGWAATPEAAARLTRTIGWIARDPVQEGMTGELLEEAKKRERLVDPQWAVDVLARVLEHDDPAPRSAAAHALAGIRTDAALDLAAATATADQDPRVRLHALRAVTKNRGVLHDGTRTLASSRLEYDDSARVREHAAVALGTKGAPGVVPILEKALKDSDWSVRVCAAVSLGKTQDPDALAPLTVWLEKEKDWRHRGAAVIGLGHLQMREAVQHIIASLGLKDTAIARSAYEILRRLTEKEIPPRVPAWRDWWEANGKDYEFLDLEEEARKAKKFGYAPDRRGVYEGQDIIVLQSRGDHIEQLLERIDIEHRLSRAGSVEKSELHPYAVFVSNCTGEITSEDVERLAWFVRVGGYLFCSCWALKHTAELVYPGMVQKFATKGGQVLDNVYSEECPTDSPYIDGVFDGVTRPIYVLYGAHLIEVLDPEGVEVLIDSPDCATRWGGGNLAAWFDAGHGTILDSANHFDLQGLEKAMGVKGIEGRKAYAMDHMGLSYDDVRAIPDKVWKSGTKANKEARDMSAFRLITNFVRQKRRENR